MKVTLILRAAVISLAVLNLPVSAWGASAKEVFTKVAPSVVVVLALDEQGRTTGQGSGVVVGDYEVVTNCHVLGEAANVAVRQAADWSGRETYRMAASLLARNDERDLCLLFVDQLPEPPAARAVRLGAAKVLSVGEEVYAVGAPAGLELSLSRGVVSQLRGAFGKRSAPLVQTDAALSPGSSGGGLFNQSGELVGITTFKWRGESLNFALPAEWIEELRGQGRSQLMDARQRIKCPKNPNYECVIDLALHEANSIKVPFIRCDRLLDIAATQTRVGDTRGAKKTLSAAFEAARESRRLPRFDGLAKIAVAQTRIRDDRAAKRTLSALEEAVRDEISDLSSFDSDEVLRAFATALAKTGNTAKALEIANSIRDGYNHRRALEAVAEEQAEAGDMANAMETAMTIGGHRSGGEYWPLRVIAFMQAKAGDFAGAIRTVMGIDASDRDGGLLDIAGWQLTHGQVESAEQTLALRSSSSRLTRMLMGIIQAKKGNFAAALAIADSLDDPVPVFLLGEIAVMQARAGDLQGAKRTLEAALGTAPGADNAHRRAVILSLVAAVQAKAGNPQSAVKVFAEALEIARTVDDEWFRNGAREDIAGGQAEAGFFADAVKTALNIDADKIRIRIRTLLLIARHLSGRPPLPWWDARKHL